MIRNFTEQVKRRISSSAKNWVFTPNDFKNIVSLTTIEKILSRLVKEGSINRVRRGLYYKVEKSRWGVVPPSQSEIIKALSRHMNTKFLPDGANALHSLGLTRQIPMKSVYLTDKRISPIVIDKMKIEFKQVSAKKLSGAGKTIGLYLSAIEHLGKDETSYEEMQQRVSKTLNKETAKELQNASKHRSAWVREVVEQIVMKVS